MVDSNPPTPGRTRGAAASSFETAASTPSSRVDTPSPRRDNKNKNNNSSKNKHNLSGENKNKKNKKKEKETVSTHDFSNIYDGSFGGRNIRGSRNT